MGLIEKTIEFSFGQKIQAGAQFAGRKLRSSSAGQWAVVGGAANTVRNLVQRNKTKKELISQGVDPEEAKKLAKKQHGSVAGALAKGAAVGAGARIAARAVGLKATSSDKALNNVDQANDKLKAAITENKAQKQVNKVQERIKSTESKTRAINDETKRLKRENSGIGRFINKITGNKK